jgi:hypothetical protein
MACPRHRIGGCGAARGWSRWRMEKPSKANGSRRCCGWRTRATRRPLRSCSRHFAPRVKAFLLKSGASRHRWQRNAQDVMATVWHKAALFDPGAGQRGDVDLHDRAQPARSTLRRKARRPEPEDLPWGPEAEPDQEEAMALQQETGQAGRGARASPREPEGAGREGLLRRSQPYGEIARITGAAAGHDQVENQIGARTAALRP